MSERLWARPARPVRRVTRWLAGGDLPAELRDNAAQRLGVLAILFAVIVVTFFRLFSRQAHQVEAARLFSTPVVPIGVGFVVLFSLAIFVLTRWKKAEPRFVLNLGLGYQVIVGLAVGVLSHLPPWELQTRVRGWSGVAVWIIVFAIVVPSSPVRSLLSSSITALMDPLGLTITVFAIGNPMPPTQALPRLFVPTFVAVVVAVVAARISYRLGRELTDARRMGSYRLVEQLGRGGMGEVWRAEHRSLARPAAIKLIRSDRLGGDSQTALTRFEREAQATATMECEHTIRVYDFGTTTDGAFYYVMELLDGIDLQRLVDRFGPLPPARVVYLLQQVCDSLAEAHHHELIHRDIKPANILTCRSGLKHDFIKVLDFGLVAHASRPSSVTTEDFVVGTPAYMAPESLEDGGKVDARADIYSLGCVAYWLLSGQPVFAERDAVKAALAHLRSTPVPLSASIDLPPELEVAVNACLEKDPAKRPQSAAELAARLRAVPFAEPWSLERAESWWEANRRAIAAPDPDEGATETRRNANAKTTVAEGRWA